jgi:hypothetical protein
MMTLLNCLSALPANVVGTNVFGFLRLTALGRLDTAVANKTRRSELLEALSFVTTVIPDLLSAEQTVQFEKEIWHWCVRRKVSLAKVWFSTVEDVEELILLEKLLVRVVFSGMVHYECDLGSDSEGSISCVLSSDTVTNRISSLTLQVTGDGGVSTWKWGDMRNIKALTVTGKNVPEQALQRIILGISALERVELRGASLLSWNALQALCGHGASLKSLSVQDARCHEELLRTVGQHCQNLNKLLVANPSREDQYPLWTHEQGWIAVAQGCRKLTNIAIWFVSGVTESALLAFAAHCPELKVLSLGTCNSTVTDAVLLAFAQGCPKLLNLGCGRWAVESVDSVDAAEALLSRLEYCPLDCIADTSPAVLARTVSYLRSVKTLSISHVWGAHMSALCKVVLALHRCEILCLYGGDNVRVVTNAFVVAVAECSPQLNVINLQRGTCISEAALRQVAQLRPDIRRVSCVHSVFKMAPKGSLVALVRNWPALRRLTIGRNRMFTDTSLLGVAQHCPQLNSLDLSHNTQVTVDALLDAVNLLPWCDFGIPGVFSTVERSRIKEAVARVRAKLPQPTQVYRSLR